MLVQLRKLKPQLGRPKAGQCKPQVDEYDRFFRTVFDFSDIQLGLDIATALSVIGAAATFIWTTHSNNEKERQARSLRFEIDKKLELIAGLEKSLQQMESHLSVIGSRINAEDAEFLVAAREWRDIFNPPEEFRIGGLLAKYVHEVSDPLKRSLRFFPFKWTLTTSAQERVDGVIEECGRLVVVKNEEPGILAHVTFAEDHPAFIDFVAEACDLAEDYVNWNDRWQEAAKKYEVLSDQQRFALKVNYLKAKRERLRSIEPDLLRLPQALEACLESLCEDVRDGLKQ